MRCPVCKTDVEDRPSEQPYEKVYACPLCGTYRLSEVASKQLHSLGQYDEASPAHFRPPVYLISAVIRERFERNRREEILIPNFDEIISSAKPLDSPLESVDKILLYLVGKASHAGENVVLEPSLDYPVAYAKHAPEFRYLLNLGESMEFFETTDNAIAKIKSKGWRRLQQLRVQEVDDNSAFVAMYFRDDLAPGYTHGIKPALEETGYRAIRVDEIHDNGKIDDRIIALIRKSALAVVDFSGHRQNVYFEAGFAMGLGRSVIFTCRRGDIAQAHFDTRQYNHVLWDNPADLKERLRDRIEATIPRATNKRAVQSPHHNRFS